MFNVIFIYDKGLVLRTKVRSRDAVGHVSDTVSSNGVTIDTTPAVRIQQSGSCKTNILSDSSFEDIASTPSNNTMCIELTSSSWRSSEDTCVSVLKSGIPHDGEIAVVVQGDLKQLVHIVNKGKYRITFFTSVVPSESLHLSAAEGYVNINGEKHMFLLYERPNSEVYRWQKHTFFFQINDDDISLIIGTMRLKSVFALDDVRLEHCEETPTELSDVRGHVKAHTVFVHDWSSLHADWTFSDPETDIIEYIWAIGTVEGGTQLQGFTNVERRTFATAHSLHFEHNTNVYVTVVAVKAAQLRTVSYSNPIKIDLTPPVFRYVYDGDTPNVDVDYQMEHTLVSQWDVYDLESGVSRCSWAIGNYPGDISIQTFVPVKMDSNNASKVLDTVPDNIVYVTVKYENGAGLTSTVSSDGVKILQAPPSADGVILELMTTSQSQFSPRDIYHGNSSEIKFRWTGFSAGEGVDNCLIELKGNGVNLADIVPSTTTGYSYATFTELDLKDGEYTVSVTAINEIQMYSERKSVKYYLLTEAPSITDEEILTTWIPSSSTAKAYWKNVFYSKHPMFYEVTVRLADEGKGDILQWQETSDTELEIEIEIDKLLSENNFTIVFSVRSVSYSGLFVIKHAELFVAV